MNQLIRITTVPIQYELKVNNARLEYSRSKAELEIRLHRQEKKPLTAQRRSLHRKDSFC